MVSEEIFVSQERLLITCKSQIAELADKDSLRIALDPSFSVKRLKEKYHL